VRLWPAARSHYRERTRRVLILVENLPVPFDRRVWQEALALHGAGYEVSVICPRTPDFDTAYEVLEGVHVYRYRPGPEATSARGYAGEYGRALFATFFLSCKVAMTRGFDVIHACNPPDLFFLIGLFFKLLGKKFVFDHHDINPELYEAKFGRRDLFYRLLVFVEYLTFRTADVSLATNDSYRDIAINRGRMAPSRVFVVRSGPSLERMRILPPDIRARHGRKHLVGYVGVMGEQEGVDGLLEVVRRIVYEHKRTDVHFALVGGGTSLAAMKQLAQRLKVADYVTFTGRAPDDILLRVLNTADVCVNPDRANAMNDKSTMNKIMEYMALGKPIVQFDLAEGRFSAQNASLYARPGDLEDFATKILLLLDDSEKRRLMGEFGRRRVLDHLEWRCQIPALLAAYAALWPAEEDTEYETWTS
jgi:glycosyltransferase involved in cell wall biosynthesis